MAVLEMKNKALNDKNSEFNKLVVDYAKKQKEINEKYEINREKSFK